MFSLEYATFAKDLPSMEKEFGSVAGLLSDGNTSSVWDVGMLSSILQLNQVATRQILDALVATKVLKKVDYWDCQHCDQLNSCESAKCFQCGRSLADRVMRYVADETHEFWTYQPVRVAERFAPGNIAVFRKFRDVLKDRAAIAFLGAGASAGIYPLWGEFLESLFSYASSRGVADAATLAHWRSLTSPLEQADAVAAALKPNRLQGLIKETYGPKPGMKYTELTRTIVGLPFKSFVTTNYDPSLVSALSEHYRDRVVRTGTWKDDPYLNEWLDGRIYRDAAALYAHGFFDRPETCLLGFGAYKEAYGLTTYRQVFQGLWQRENLVFVGYGFNDEWLKFLTREDISVNLGSGAEPRHIAFLAIPNGADYTKELRTYYWNTYDMDVFFYDSRKGHGQITALLQLAGRSEL